MSGATAALRSPIGPIAADPELRGFFRQLMDEALRRRQGQGRCCRSRLSSTSAWTSSLKGGAGHEGVDGHDLERGNRLELDWLAGKVRELGRALGIPTPASDTVYTVLKLHRMGGAR